MANTIKRIGCLLLALVMCVGIIPATAFAAMTIDGNTWYGDELSVDVTAGTDGYTFMSLFRKPAHGYEFSGHFMGDGEGPQTFVVIDTEKYDGTTWTPSGRYVFGNSNYEVAYCCDVETTIVDGTYYKRVNLEDSKYYSAEQAAKIRAIVTNSYPYVSLEAMKADLAKNGYAYAEELTRNEIIAAVQTAIWACANAEGVPMRYAKSYKVSDNLQWGYPLYDTSAESGLDVSGKRVFKTYEEVGTRIDSLVDYLLEQKATYAEKHEIVISELKILDAIPVIGKGNTYEVVLHVALNGSGSGSKDDIDLDVIVDGETIKTTPVKLGTEVYTMKVEIEAGQTIEAVVSGTQVLPLGVYFYAPKPSDVDGDGVATGREVSQNLVAAAEGATPVYADGSVTLDIKPVFGNLQLQKVDEKGQPLSGVVFELNVEGNSGMLPVGTYEVDEKGQLSIDNLLPGTYELKEVKAPYGYAIPTGSISFEVTKDGLVKVEETDFAKISNAEEAHEIVIELETEKELTADEIADLGVSAPAIDVEIELVPENETETTETETMESVIIGEKPAEGDTIYDYTEVELEAYRKVTVTVSAVKTEVKYNETENIIGVQSALKFDRNDTADQKAQKVARELYTDNGHFHDPSTFTVTDAPEGYPWKYVGHGDYSGHYVSHVRVIYARDEAGNALKDENGNYIIKELQHAGSGTPLYYNGELVTNPEGPFHYATGTRPQQFLLMNEKGETIYGYCIDLETGAQSGKWYAMANLEDNDYYASEEAENHVRNIVMNGYWGTAEGTGSLASLKEALKAAAKANLVDVEQDVTLVNRKKFTTGYELQEGEYHHGNYVYWSLPTEHVVLTDEVIDQMTEGEALDAMQAAIWSWANGSNATLNGVDRAIVGDLYVASSQISDSLNGKNDPEGAARTKALYQYLMGLNEAQETTVIINDKTFAKDITLNVGENLGNGIYAAELKFTVGGDRNENDNLKVVLTYTDVNGEEKTVEVALTGEGAAIAENGYYTISGLELAAGIPFEYSLQIIGEQYLEKGAYIFSAQGGVGASQTMVTLAEGTKSVDVTKSMSITFEVEEGVKGNYTRHWSDSKTLVVVNEAPSITFESGDASNISFMLVDANGNVEFLYKKDIGNETSFEIPVEEGKISAVFVKQGTSGMFWFSEEVDEDIQEAVIECLKDNNPSYKGHNAIAFGAGDHELEFKKNKFVTYTFSGTFGMIEEESAEEVEDESVEEPVEEETPAPETEDNGKKNKNNKKKNK